MATSARFQFTAVDQSGSILPGATVEVRRASDNVLMSLWSDRAGTVALGNPFAADAGGFAGFYINSGVYNIIITSGSLTRTWSWVPISLVMEQSELTFTLPADATINGHRVGRGLGNVSTNVAIGSGAMGTGVNTGAQNVAIGFDALKNHTTGINNVAVGRDAGLSVTTGTGNVCIGRLAGSSLTTGTNNNAIGTNALMSCTTSNNNVAQGANALRFCTTGIGNSAVGVSALTAVTTGVNNMGVGSSSGLLLTTGSSNVLIGVNAGDVLTTGGENTLIGRAANVDAADAAGCLALGRFATALKATGATSADNGPGISIGSASSPVGFRGDGTIYPTSGASAGFWRVRVNGTVRKIQLFADV
jgi:hypothetical protein